MQILSRQGKRHLDHSFSLIGGTMENRTSGLGKENRRLFLRIAAHFLNVIRVVPADAKDTVHRKYHAVTALDWHNRDRRWIYQVLHASLDDFSPRWSAYDPPR